MVRLTQMKRMMRSRMMRSRMKQMVFAILALLNVVPSIAAQSQDREIGALVAVERSFKIDINECEKTYRKVSLSSAFCRVEVLPARADLKISGASISSDRLGMNVTLVSDAGGYSFQVYSFDGSEANFSAARAAIENLVNQLPGRELKIVVYTTK